MTSRRHSIVRILLPLAVVPLLWGCIQQPGGIAPSNVPLSGRTYHVLGETSDTDSAIRLFGFLPVSGSNTIRSALAGAMRKKDADALINITVDAYTQYWILFTRTVTAVHGTAVKLD